MWSHILDFLTGPLHVIFMDEHELEMEHLRRDPHYSMEPFYQRYNYLDDTYHTAPAYYTEKAPLHKVIDPSYFKAYEGWHINIKNAITYQALKNMMMIFHGFQDLYISSSTSTTATFVCLLPTENQMLTPVSKFLGQEVRDKTKHELNIQRIIRRIPTHIKGHYVEKPLRDDHPHPGAALCLPHIAQIVFSKYESANTALIASQWYETTVRIATMARKGFQIGDKLFLEDLPTPTTKPLHDGRVILIQKANPRPSHLERQLQDDMEWNAILAITRQHTVEEYQQYLPPEILGVHKLILYVNTKLQEWQTRNNESCLQNNIFSRADIHMMIHVLKFFSPRHAEWRFTREIFGPDYTILDFNGSTCAIPMQPLRDNLTEWLRQHKRLVSSLLHAEHDHRQPNHPLSSHTFFEDVGTISDEEELWQRRQEWNPVQRFPTTTYNSYTEPDLSVD